MNGGCERESGQREAEGRGGDVPYEMYRPMVAILVTAENATELPRLGRARMKLSVHASHTIENI